MIDSFNNSAEEVSKPELRPMGVRIKTYDKLNLSTGEINSFVGDATNGREIWALVKELGGEVVISSDEASTAVAKFGTGSKSDDEYLLTLRERFRLAFPNEPFPSSDSVPSRACLGIAKLPLPDPADAGI